MKKITLTLGIILLTLSGCSESELKNNGVELVSAAELNSTIEISAIDLAEHGEVNNDGTPPLAEINIPQAAEYITGTPEIQPL